MGGIAVCGLVRQINKRMVSGKEIETYEIEYLDSDGEIKTISQKEHQTCEIKSYNYDEQARFVRQFTGYESAEERSREMKEEPALKPVVTAEKPKEDVPF